MPAQRLDAAAPAQGAAATARADAEAVSSLCRAVPSDTLGTVLPQIIDNVNSECVATVLAPLISDPELCAALVALLDALDADSIAEIASAVPAQKLHIVLRTPPEKLTALIGAVDSGRIKPVLIPVLQEPEELLRDTIVPLLSQVDNPERVAALANQVEPEVLFRLLREIDTDRLVALCNALKLEDFEPD
eukprot:CAMPEP_0195084598 /NCGR_PEP_ID=MMETSP0448-20130528/25247_1 /TAXON_ID=66468 /ORGANISM="Heterocapsa triquestra, Strain CCMP 448" /LENGTH=189 /DNA_ID=CAMNT_0040117933 /DNA_START=151 /DNA_END=718 /DNA_ORIENTATION=+